jgi:putative transposase
MDFVSDTLSSGHRFRCLNIMDEFSRECVAIYPSRSIPAVRVIDVLERLREERGLPDIIVTDNGSEFTSRAFDAWAHARGVRRHPPRPSVVAAEDPAETDGPQRRESRAPRGSAPTLTA